MRKYTLEELNYDYLWRQCLIQPKTNVEDVLGRLIAIQAQDKEPPYTALYSRVKNFQVSDLLNLFEEKKVVKATSFRGTVQMMRRSDYLNYQPIIQEKFVQTLVKKLGQEKTTEFLTNAKQEIKGKGALTGPQLREMISSSEYPINPEYLRYPLTQVRVPRKDGAIHSINDYWLTIEEHVGESISTEVEKESFVLRYLKAYGPATVADIHAFVGIATFKETFHELLENGKIAACTDDKNRKLFMVDELRQGNTKIPEIILGASLDHLTLGLKDKRKIVHKDATIDLWDLSAYPVILVNGWICGHWFIHKDDSIEVKWFVSVTSDVKKRALAEVEKYRMWRNGYF